MALRVRRTARADADLDAIWLNIAQDSEPAADRVLTRLFAAEDRLAAFPEMGPLRDELAPGVRSWVVADYLIFCRVDPDSIIVLRVLHGARDIGQLLAEP